MEALPFLITLSYLPPFNNVILQIPAVSRYDNGRELHVNQVSHVNSQSRPYSADSFRCLYSNGGV